MDGDPQTTTDIQDEIAALRARVATLEQERDALRDQLTISTQALDAIPDLVIIAAPEARLSYANRAFQDFTGLTLDQLRDPAAAPGLAAALLGDGQARDIPQQPLTRHDGAVRLFHTMISPPLDAGGQPPIQVAVAHDITQRAGLMRDLEHQQQRLDSLIVNLPGIVWETVAHPERPTQRLTFVSRQVEDILGYTVEECLSQPNFWLTIMHPEDQQRILNNPPVLEPDFTHRTSQYRCICKDGRLLWVENHISPICDAEGRMVGMHGISLDITARTEAEAQLRRERDYTRLLIDSAPVLIVGVAPDGTTTFINRRVEEVTGYQADELIGQNWWTKLYPGASYGQVAPLGRDARWGTLPNYQAVLTTRAGQPRTITWNAITQTDASGAVTEVVGFGLDITGQLQAEAEQQRLQSELIRMQAETLRELSTPLIPITDRVVVMPLIGAIDTQRAAQVLETLLHGITQGGAEVAILDITGVPVVDTQVATGLVRAAQAVKLLGAQVVLTGIRPEVAQILVELGVNLSGIVTQSTLQRGIAFALA